MCFNLCICFSLLAFVGWIEKPVGLENHKKSDLFSQNLCCLKPCLTRILPRFSPELYMASPQESFLAMQLWTVSRWHHTERAGCRAHHARWIKGHLQCNSTSIETKNHSKLLVPCKAGACKEKA